MPNKGLRKINHHQPSPGRSVHYPACQEWEWRAVTFQATEVWEDLETRHLVFLMNNASLNVHKPPSVGTLRPKSLPIIPAPVCPFISTACGNPAAVHLTPRLAKDHKVRFSWDVLSQHGNCRMKAERGWTLEHHHNRCPEEKVHPHKPGSVEAAYWEPTRPTCHGYFTSHCLGFHIYLTRTKCLLWVRTSLRYNYPHFTAEERDLEGWGGVIYNNICLVFIYCSWHRAPKTLGICQVRRATKVSFVMLMRWLRLHLRRGALY